MHQNKQKGMTHEGKAVQKNTSISADDMCCHSFGCVERALGRQLSTQQIASEWSAEGSYAQISAFSKDAAVTKDYVIQLEQKLKTALRGGVRGYIGCKRKNAGGLLQHKRGTYPLF